MFGNQHHIRIRFWSSIILYQIAVNIIYGLNNYNYSVGTSLLNLLTTLAGLADLTYSIGAFYVIFYLLSEISSRLDQNFNWNTNPLKRFFIQTLAGAILAGGSTVVLYIGVNYLLLYKLFNSSEFISLQNEILRFLVLSSVIGLNVFYEFCEYLLNKWWQSKAAEERFEKEKAEFQLDLLKTQINPHFLFNNLNTLSSLVHQDADKASLFIRKLASVYRNILEYKNKETVTLQEELQFHENYAQLLSIRFQDMLFFDVQVEDTYKSYKIIPLTLQMLTENAIKHNILSQNRPLTIYIYVSEQYLCMRNAIQSRESKEYSSKLGFQIIGSRYRFLTNREIMIEHNEKYFTVKVPILEYNESTYN